MRRSKKGNTAISEADVKASLTDRASFTDAVKIIGTCKTIEEFWSIYNYLVRPHELPATTDYHFFREGVKPTWEVNCSTPKRWKPFSYIYMNNRITCIKGMVLFMKV